MQRPIIPFLALVLTFFFTSSVSALPQQISATSQSALLSNKHPDSDHARMIAEQIVAAYGGQEVLQKVVDSGSRSLGKVLEYSTISGAANSFDCEIMSKGERMRIALDVMGQHLIYGYNGSHGWVQQGDLVFKANETTEQRIKEEIEHGLILMLKLLRPDTKLKLLPAATIFGRLCDVLQVTSSDGKPTLLYADQKTHLIVQSEYQGFDAEQGVEAAKTYTYEDYRPFDGSFVPYRVTEYSGKLKASETILSSTEDVDLEDKLFEAPEIASTTIGKDEVIEVPFEYLSNEVVLKAKVNDKEELPFIVDTGATQSVLDRAVAKSLGNLQESDLKMTTGSGSVNLAYMTLPSLALGSLNLKDLHFAVADLSAFSQILGQRPSGLIGANILRRFLVCFDYPHRKVILSHPDSVAVTPNMIIIPTRPAFGMSGLVVEGELDGKKFSFLVDTGAAFNNISTTLAKSILNCPILPVGTIEGLDNKKVKIGAVRFKTLKIGPLTVHGPAFSVAPSDSNPSGIISAGSLAILGNPLWGEYRMTVDYKNQRLLLSSPADQEYNDDALNRLRRLRIRHLDEPSLNLISQYQDLLQEIRAKHLVGAEAICLADLALLCADLDPHPLTRESESKVLDMFREALAKADEAAKPAVKAQVLATWAIYYITDSTDPDSIKLAKGSITEAIKSSSTDSSAYAATAMLLSKLHQVKLTEQLADQALMLDPSNWRALWLKYEVAGQEGALPLQNIVVDQLRRYYADSKSVRNLTASGTPVSSNNGSHESSTKSTASKSSAGKSSAHGKLHRKKSRHRLSVSWSAR
jgi:hypothetical protein